VFEKSRGAAHVECVVREGERLYLADLEADRKVKIHGALSGLGDHDFTRVEPSKTAGRTDELHHVEQIGSGTAANVEHRLSRR
jgi:hypothetical protein